jgi:hypothetical protein
MVKRKTVAQLKVTNVFPVSLRDSQVHRPENLKPEVRMNLKSTPNPFHFVRDLLSLIPLACKSDLCLLVWRWIYNTRQWELRREGNYFFPE